MSKIYKIIIKTYQGVGLIFNNTRIIFGIHLGQPRLSKHLKGAFSRNWGQWKYGLLRNIDPSAEYRSERGILIREFQGVDLDELVTMPVMGIMALMRLLVQNDFSPPRVLPASLFRFEYTAVTIRWFIASSSLSRASLSAWTWIEAARFFTSKSVTGVVI